MNQYCPNFSYHIRLKNILVWYVVFFNYIFFSDATALNFFYIISAESEFITQKWECFCFLLLYGKNLT